MKKIWEAFQPWLFLAAMLCGVGLLLLALVEVPHDSHAMNVDFHLQRAIVDAIASVAFFLIAIIIKPSTDF